MPAGRPTDYKAEYAAQSQANHSWHMNAFGFQCSVCKAVAGDWRSNKPCAQLSSINDACESANAR